jgi:3-phosphoshikimate 1-carboxyvinyltransferase
LLAALGAAGRTTVEEPGPSRDHGERMLRAFGASVECLDGEGRHGAALDGPCRLRSCDVEVPGDISSAAFPIVAAAILPGSAVRIVAVGLNPGRTGLIETLAEMGADIAIENRRETGGEPVGDVVVHHAPLRGVAVPADRAVRMIDEYPALCIAAACAEGTTHMAGLAELRVKESDRIDAMAGALSACGIAVDSGPDWMAVTGERIAGGATIDADGDHRVAMALLVAGLAADAPVHVRGAATIGSSWPGFVAAMRALGADIGDSL